MYSKRGRKKDDNRLLQIGRDICNRNITSSCLPLFRVLIFYQKTKKEKDWEWNTGDKMKDNGESKG